MTQLDRGYCAQQFAAVEHNEILIVRGEYAPVGQPSMNGVAGEDEIRGLFANIKHSGLLTNRETKSAGGTHRSAQRKRLEATLTPLPRAVLSYTLLELLPALTQELTATQ